MKRLTAHFLPKLMLLICCILLLNTGFCQTKKTGEIIAEGGAKIKARPDIAIVTLTIQKTDTIEKKAMLKLNMESDELVKTLNKIGFTNKMIKISDYTISSNNYRDDEDKKKYIASSELKLEFQINMKLIDALYSEIQKENLTDLDISFSTKLSDTLEKKTRTELVYLAIADAKENATVIAKSLGIKLQKIKLVSKYNREIISRNMEINMVKFTPPKIVNDNESNYVTPFSKFEVDDVELEEAITIVYEVLN